MESTKDIEQRRTPPAYWPDGKEQCLCGHLFREHGQNGTCWATVWRTHITNEGEEARPVARYCPCYLFAGRT